jgi:hypothetical protein
MPLALTLGKLNFPKQRVYVILTANSDNFLKEHFLTDITEKQFAFCEIQNEFLYYLECSRETINL